MPDMETFIGAVRQKLERESPSLLPLFTLLAQEARFGREWIDGDLKNLNPGARILEVGGGVFLLSCQLAREGYDITAIEPSGSGFGAFRQLGEKVLSVADLPPRIADCPAEDFASDELFDYAFSVNVMEHVNDPNAAIRRVAASLNGNAAYRFVCPNYLFPYEPHFNIPTLFSKALTEKVMQKRIFGSLNLEDPAGLWKSLNWITVPEVRRLAANENLSLSFKKDTLVWMLERAIDDPEFAKRRSGWMTRVVKAARRCRALDFARHIPAALQPVMDCRLTKRDLKASQTITGFRAILSSPFVYDAFQSLMGVKRARELIVQKYIRPFDGMRILDLGCGTAKILNFLPPDIVYHGYDISPEYISHARMNFGKRGVFSCKVFDASEAAILPKFDLVMMLGVLHHMDDVEASRLLALAKSALKPNGRLLTRDPCYADNQNPLARLLISCDRGQHVRSAEEYRALTQNHLSSVEGDLIHQAWIPYTHWTMECRA